MQVLTVTVAVNSNAVLLQQVPALDELGLCRKVVCSELCCTVASSRTVIIDTPGSMMFMVLMSSHAETPNLSPNQCRCKTSLGSRFDRNSTVLQSET